MNEYSSQVPSLVFMPRHSATTAEPSSEATCAVWAASHAGRLANVVSVMKAVYGMLALTMRVEAFSTGK